MIYLVYLQLYSSITTIITTIIYFPGIIIYVFRKVYICDKVKHLV